MSDLPQGIITFLFTDVEGSTALWEQYPESMMEALRQHDDAIDGAAHAHRGIPVKPRGEGDSRFVVFTSAAQAVAAAADIQRGFADIDWATPDPLRIRVALHTGAADLQLGDYYGSSVNRAARLRGIAHGGQTLMSRSTWELVQDALPDDLTVVDMGEHRLKDLTRPEHVYQLTSTEFDEDFPPLQSLDAVPNNLPIQLTDFIGRPEVDEIKSTVSDSRLLTIIAPGGAGKTRSAIQAAADLTADFPDGVFFIDLAALSTPKDIAQTAAESIGVSLATDEDLQTQLLAHLANKRQLLLFDNFEHLIPGAGLVSDILVAASDVKVIVTSRTKLNVTGETVYSLPGLVIEWDTADEAFLATGVRLFIDAAKRADATFSLTFDDLESLQQILGLVGGLPLGILLAASWVDILRVDEIAAEITKSMDFLEVETRDVPDRHRSMRAAFDYSWSMLDDDERRVYAELAVFRGGFTRDAADRVAGASLRGLSNLVSKSLLIFDRESRRYAIHELLRQYAEEALREDEARHHAAVQSHLAFFAEFASRAIDDLISTGRDQAGAFLRIETELDNLRAALHTALDAGDAEAARLIMFALLYLYEIRGWTKAGAEMFGEIREAFSGEAVDSETRIVSAAAASIEAKFLTNLGHVDTAGPLAEEALTLLQGSADPVALIGALEAVAEISVYRGDYDRVVALSEQAIETADAAGIEMWSAGMRNYLAGAYAQTGDIDSAIRVLQEGEEVLARLDERFMRAWNVEMQAFIAAMQERFDDAIELRHREVELARSVRYVRAEALGLQGLGQGLAASGDFSGAAEAYVEALGLFEQMGLVVEQATVIVAMAPVQARLGDPVPAVEMLSSVLAHSVSEQLLMFEQTTIRDAATEALADLKQHLASDELAAAQARGSSTPLDVIIKELLTVT